MWLIARQWQLNWWRLQLYQLGLAGDSASFIDSLNPKAMEFTLKDLGHFEGKELLPLLLSH